MAKNKKPERALRDAVVDVLSSGDFSEMEPAQRAALASRFVWEWASKQPAKEPNKGESWSDDALRVILQEAPTHANIVRLARAFGRGVGSVEQIYRWAATPDKEVRRKRPDDAFISQIKKIAKEVGWEAF